MKKREINKILVANRGEIAIRIFRAASEINVRTVAIYTYEDRYSLHRYKADEAYQVGEKDDPLKPYLDIDEIIRVAIENQVDAIHPGYGFLSENPTFAERCISAGIIWIGPSPEVMGLLGDKIQAKTVAIRNQVPVIEASKEALLEYAPVKDSALKIGFPVMIKAATGGGGRGMRVVRSENELEKLYIEASREAKTAFGNPAVFVEKYVENPKHIEVQIIGDESGNILHLYERDCSVQRRYQKVVEVAPSVNLKQETKDKLYTYAMDICRDAGYVNAGTVEFLVDREENIYFIEVNTRIQVEHTITEVVTGIDIVRTQIMVACGHDFSDEEIGIASQEDISMRGYAIQCRITTENPSNGFKPDYGRLVAYRSASGFGIRLDAGNAYAGATISPFFDSMLVKVTAWGHTLGQSADRLHRALREFRIRGVKSNIPFLLNILKAQEFRDGMVTVNYIAEHPELLKPPGWKDRGTKLIRFMGDVIVNKNADVKAIDETKILLKPTVPPLLNNGIEKGTKNLLTDHGPQGVVDYLKGEKKILFTDTTFRDAHQSLLATRMRTYDLEKVADNYAEGIGHQLFSMEVWGGATYDVAMRFLKESPWQRLRNLRKRLPNVMLQMLLRGSNAVGYKAYPDNLVEAFVVQAAEEGIDVFRIFDSLNWVEAMKTSIQTVVRETSSIAEACICYTGDLLGTGDNRFNLQYYLDLAREVEDAGAHILVIKDMAGLLKPDAATILVGALKEAVDMPIHLHTHDTSSIQSTTYLSAINAGVDIVDVAISSLSGITSQPNFNSLIAMLSNHDRNPEIDQGFLSQMAQYWEAVRSHYYPFESELKSGTADVYHHEIPGGQYSNLRPQARGLGLEDRFEEIKENYKTFNEMLGGIVKVTPSSKVVGDMAMFMTTNDLTGEDLITKGDTLSFPESVKSLMRGDLGQWKFGWPEDLQKAILKDEKPYTNKPNAHLEPINWEEEMKAYESRFPEGDGKADLLSYLLYPKVYEAYYEHYATYGDVSKLPTVNFFYGLKPNEEITVEISRGKTILIEFLNANQADEYGNRLVIFRLNGAIRTVVVKDLSITSETVSNIKVTKDGQIGTPLQGSLSKIMVSQGEEVVKNQPLFIIEAMKMETTVIAPEDGMVDEIYLSEKSLVEQDDAVLLIKKE